MWCEQVFSSFLGVVCGEYDGCKSGDRVCCWGVGVGMLEVVCGVRMGVGVGSSGKRRGCD